MFDLALDAGTFGLSQLSADLQMRRQKKLLADQYSQYIDNMKQYGATNQAIVQGLGGSMSSTPAASSPAAVPDLSQNASQREDVASLISRRETENSFDRMKMYWQPSLWSMDIKKAFSEIARNYGQSDLFKHQGRYFTELANSLELKRPWELKQLEAGLRNTLKEYEEIVSRINKNKSEAGLFDTQSGYYSQLTENEVIKHDILINDRSITGLKAVMSEAGWDPDSKPWDNVFRWAVHDPGSFEHFMHRSIAVMGVLDNVAKDSLGENYKRNALIIGGLHYLNNRLGEHNTNTLRRLNYFTGSVGNILPFAFPSVESVPSPRAGTYWWEKD